MAGIGLYSTALGPKSVYSRYLDARGIYSGFLTQPISTGPGNYNKTGTDGAKATDSSTPLRTRPVTATDGAKASDSSTAPRTRPAAGTDGARAGDSATASVTGPPVAVLSGTATEGITEADLVAGGRTFVLTISGDTWIP